MSTLLQWESPKKSTKLFFLPFIIEDKKLTVELGAFSLAALNKPMIRSAPILGNLVFYVSSKKVFDTLRQKYLEYCLSISPNAADRHLLIIVHGNICKALLTTSPSSKTSPKCILLQCFHGELHINFHYNYNSPNNSNSFNITDVIII